MRDAKSNADHKDREERIQYQLERLDIRKEYGGMGHGFSYSTDPLPSGCHILDELVSFGRPAAAKIEEALLGYRGRYMFGYVDGDILGQLKAAPYALTQENTGSLIYLKHRLLLVALGRVAPDIAIPILVSRIAEDKSGAPLEKLEDDEKYGGYSLHPINYGKRIKSILIEIGKPALQALSNLRAAHPEIPQRAIDQARQAFIDVKKKPPRSEATDRLAKADLKEKESVLRQIRRSAAPAPTAMGTAGQKTNQQRKQSNLR